MGWLEILIYSFYIVVDFYLVINLLGFTPVFWGVQFFRTWRRERWLAAGIPSWGPVGSRWTLARRRGKRREAHQIGSDWAAFFAGWTSVKDDFDHNWGKGWKSDKSPKTPENYACRGFASVEDFLKYRRKGRFLQTRSSLITLRHVWLLASGSPSRR